MKHLHFILFTDTSYAGADCSERQCAYGIDPLWTDDTTARVTQTVVRFESDNASAFSGQYAIKFFDVFGEDYITKPITISPDGVVGSDSHCDLVEDALLSLPDSAITDIRCSESPVNTNQGVEYTLTFTGNPGKLQQLEIIENLDGSRPTVLVSSGTYTVDVYTKVNGEFEDHFAEKCEGVTLKVLVDSDDSTNILDTVGDVRPGSIGYLADMDANEEKLLKACLGHSDYDPDNNVDVANWDEGSIEEADGSGPVTKYKMIGAFPHAIKVVPKEDTTNYDQYTPGEYYLVWYDSDATNKFRVANVNNNANQLSEAKESYVFTTKGTVQQLGWSDGTELANNAAGSLSTPRIVGYFDKYTNKVYTNYDTSCENQPASPNDRNHVCIEKGAKLFIVDGCWGKGNSGASSPATNPFFGGTEVSCSNSNTDINHNTGNLYTVTKVRMIECHFAISLYLIVSK